MKVYVFLLLVAIFGYGSCRIFSRCDLAVELERLRVSRTFLGNWVCLIEQVSKRDTAMQQTDSNGKSMYGLYQIPSKWCEEGKAGGFCNIACESLLDEDITDDTHCAESIFLKEGLKFWSPWLKKCKDTVDQGDNKLTMELSKCPGMKPNGGLEYAKYALTCDKSVQNAYCYVTQP